MKSLSSLCVQRLAKSLHLLAYPSADHLELASAARLPVHIRQQIIECLNSSGWLSDVLGQALSANGLQALEIPRNNLSDPTLTACVKACHQLETFDCSHRLLPTELLDQLCEEPRASSLRVLRLSNCGLVSSQVQRLLRCCRRLEALDVSGSHGLSDDMFDLCSPVPTFRALASVCCDEYNLLAASILGAEVQLPVVQHRKRKRDEDSMTSPIAKRTKIEEIDSAMEDFDMLPVISSPSTFGNVYLRPHLATLNLAGCVSLTNRALTTIAVLCPLLQHLDISGCNLLYDLGSILTKCPHLKSLNLSDTSIGQHVDMPLPAVTLAQLTELEMLRFSGSGMLAATFTTWLRSCRSKLRVLEIRNKFIADLFGFAELISGASSLSSLDLYDTNVDASSLSTLASGGKLVSLSSLDVTNCASSVTVDTIASAAPHLPALTRLALSGVYDGCGLAFAFIGTKCPNLRCLSVGSVRNGVLKQNDVCKMLRSLPKLTELELWCCEFVTYRLAAAIPQLCSNIRSVLLSAIGPNGNEPSRSCVTQHELGQLERFFPHVQFRLWQHCSRGNRYFQSTPGILSEAQLGPINNLQIEVISQAPLHDHPHDHAHNHEAHTSQVRPLLTKLFVDGRPLWSTEKAVSFAQLKSLTTPNYGALPVVEDWCCGCNIHEFNGVLYYADPHSPVDSLVWLIRDPGPTQAFRFEKRQVVAAIQQAEAAFCNQYID